MHARMHERCGRYAKLRGVRERVWRCVYVRFTVGVVLVRVQLYVRVFCGRRTTVESLLTERDVTIPTDLYWTCVRAIVDCSLYVPA